LLQWSTTGPPGVIGIQVAAPFFLYEDDTTPAAAKDGDKARAKRKRVKVNFIGRVTHFARDPASSACFYRVTYSDGGTEDIDEPKLSDSLKLFAAISRGEEKEGLVE